MIQDIYPSRLDNSFRNCTMNEDDFLLVFDHEGRLLTGEQDGNIRFTSGCDIESDAAVYLFSVDDRRYFLASDKAGYTVQGFEYRTIRELRDRYSGKDKNRRNELKSVIRSEVGNYLYSKTKRNPMILSVVTET